ncbi:phosphatidylinositol 4-phosphate 3-kinase C2 domain-containing subunit alpha [Denticeps clupeoides]|nr:phosphatidylinositol 4-phosphate 3-kinase C2 domain-containing subunit alpha [Denticeps clupeoides]
MAQISSGNGCLPPSPKMALHRGAVDKEEALRMEAEALARLQREKRNTVPSPSLSSSLSVSSGSASGPTSFALATSVRPEKDLIFFPESDSKKQDDKDKFGTINVDKLTNEELEELLLDDYVVTKPHPSSLSASYPGGHVFNSAPFHQSSWTPSLSRPSSSNLSTASRLQPGAFPTPHFPNGYNPTMATFLPPRQPHFLAFSTVPPRPLLFHSPAVSPEMAKLFDKIASTSEYLRNGKSSGTDMESSNKSLEPAPPPQPAVPPVDLPSMSRFEWLDLDPLSMRRGDVEEAAPCPPVGEGQGSGQAGDPWDAVLQDETEGRDRSAQVKMHPRRASTGNAVTRSQSLSISETSSQQTQNKQINKGNEKVLSKYPTLQEKDAQNLEVNAFCEDVANLKSKFVHSDLSTNPGYVLSPVISQQDVSGESSSSVKVSIEIPDSQQPVTFTCDVSSSVELLIIQALCWVHDDLNQVDIGSYVLKVCGQEAVLQNKHSLGSHEYVQNCRKWEAEIQLQLLSQCTMKRDLARTEADDSALIDLEKHLGQVERPFKETVTRQGIVEYLEVYHNQIQLCLQNQSTQYKIVDQVIQAVKNLCCALDEVETPAITEAVKRLRHAVNMPHTRSPKADAKSSSSLTKGKQSPMEDSVAILTNAVYQMVKLYLRSFCPTSSVTLNTDSTENRDCREASGTTDHLQFTLFALHGIPTSWVSSYEKYYMTCALMHNNRNIFKPVQSKKVGTYKSFFYHIKWDELINFPIPVAQLPLEAMLNLSLYGVLNQNAGGSPDSNKQRKGTDLLGKVSMALFDFRRVMVRDTQLLCLWASVQAAQTGRKRNLAERIILQVDFPCPTVNVLYVAPPVSSYVTPQIKETLDPDIRRKVEKLCSHTSSIGLTRADRQLLWEYRHHCREFEGSLARVLASTPSWEWSALGEIHSLLHSWPPLSPINALELLDSKFAETEVRTVAVSWLESISNDELTDYLPQLVQALKFERHLRNSLVMFLLSRAQSNVNTAHYLYWLLRDTVQDSQFGSCYEKVLGALLCLCGGGMRAELEKQTKLVQQLGTLAENVRQAGGSSRQAVLQDGLERVQSFFQKHTCRLPLSPSLVATELNVKGCSFFNSNAVPLKIALVNADPLGEEINVMFKVGEDLRQDMLALQMIRIMDRIWLQEGLDLRIVNFKCISTGKDKGMVELVPSSETLRKIQVEYGVTGSFKDKPIAEWLRKYNPAEDEYEKACENFIYSCAGCCVATYLLGICDRHNDNIMLRSTGHMFHIDFGKFLGHAQMIGSFKRDRAPFVLTSDMAYVINGGERPTIRFQLFVDLCSQAYNLIRKHSNLFLNLLSLMMKSGLPELTGHQDLMYVYDALQPQTTDAEATIFFTRLIESSLGSMATKFNFFIHNLAQLRFSGLPSNDESILSFSPRTYTVKQDGRICEASIFSFHKRYNPDKHYTYVVRILREGQTEPQFVFRTFDEFQELHNKLSILFPLWKLPGFPNKMVLGRTHIKEVASKRKVELNSYVHSLMRGSLEVTQCDLIYTFFHPVARDDRMEGFEGVPKAQVLPQSPVSSRVEGEVKLSVSYRNSTLFIMVMHIRDLVSDDEADPNPYVKTYLLPDPHKTSKRKTKISRRTKNPTFNEMLVYSGYSKETLNQRELQLSVLSAESLRENCFLGGVTLGLKDFDLSRETVKWFKLTAGPY